MTRLVAESELIQISEKNERPDAFDWRGERHHIVEANKRWRIDVGWWDPAISTWRDYFEVLTDTGYLCVIYHDLPDGEWFLTRLYD